MPSPSINQKTKLPKLKTTLIKVDTRLTTILGADYASIKYFVDKNPVKKFI